MPTCPSGHHSADADYCETCGVRISATPTTVLGVVSGSPQVCPQCGDRLIDRFCEGCGYDTLQPQGRSQPPPPWGGGPPPSGHVPGQAVSTVSAGSTGSAQPWSGLGVGWLAVVAADRGYYKKLMTETGSDPGALPYPTYHPERQYPLTSQFLRIGRRSVGRGIRPDIDLSLPPEDPAVSHEHALLLSKPAGNWALVDLGSSNGTLLNDDPEPVPSHVEVPLHDGDRIYVGAWTVITLRKG